MSQPPSPPIYQILFRRRFSRLAQVRFSGRQIDSTIFFIMNVCSGSVVVLFSAPRNWCVFILATNCFWHWLLNEYFSTPIHGTLAYKETTVWCSELFSYTAEILRKISLCHVFRLHAHLINVYFHVKFAWFSIGQWAANNLDRKRAANRVCIRGPQIKKKFSCAWLSFFQFEKKSVINRKLKI